MTKITSALPGGAANGLTAIARDLIDNPHEVHVVVALVDCKKITTDNDSGEIVPTARIRRIEVIGGDDKDLAAKMIRRALEHRTGKTVLPFDLEEDLRAAFGNIDPHTGEILGDGGSE
jgi:hypothetical protein